MTASTVLPYDLTTVHAKLQNGGIIPHDAELALIPYEPAFPRRPDHYRWHYRVENAKRPICHLIVGRNISQIKQRTEDIFHACPELICRPLLFWEQADGTGYLALEHFEGASLEMAVQEGRCGGKEWLGIVRGAQGLLARTEKPSDQIALQHEIRGLFENVSEFPGFSEIDAKLTRELIEPLLLERASFAPLTTRWSNGDFIGRNLLINGEGAVRLIDYEHAQPTHFWRDDWRRLVLFSQLPQGLEARSIEEVNATYHPWEKIHFWLYNLSQLGDAEPSDVVNRHVAAVTRELFKAVDEAGTQAPNKGIKSFLLATLAGQQSEGKSFITTPRDERYRERKIREDLDQANCRLAALNREIAQQEITLRSGKGSLEQARLTINALTFEARHLRDGLVKASTHIDRLLERSEATVSNASASAAYGLEHSSNIAGDISLTGWVMTNGSKPHEMRLHLGQAGIFDCKVVAPVEDTPAAVGRLRTSFFLQAYLPAGLHIITLEYRTPSTQHWVPFCTRSLWVDISPLFLRLEQPIPPVRPSGKCQVQGWCFHPQEEIAEISVRHGITTATLSHGMARPDVDKKYPWNRTAQHSGFSGVIELLPSQGDVVLTVILRSGAILHEVIARKILVVDESAEKTLPPSLVTFVVPSPNHQSELCRLHEALLFGTQDTIRPFLDFGWQEPEQSLRWVIGPRAGLRFRFDPDEYPRQMKVLLVPLIVSGQITRQRIYVELPNALTPGIVELTRNEPQEVLFHLPETALVEDTLNLQFSFPDARRPEEVGLSNDVRLLSVGFISLTFS